MAVNVTGFDGTVNEAGWSELWAAAGTVSNQHGVSTGLAVTTVAGTRAVSVSTGTAFVAGLLVKSTTAVTLNHAANPGSAVRVDHVVLRMDWTANTGTIAIVQGTSSVAPSLTQTPGGLWEMPLARVAVRGGVTTILTSDITPAKPLPRQARLFRGSPMASVTRGPSSNPYTVSSVTITDPGWPYILNVVAAARFDNTSSGFAQMTAGIGSGGSEIVGTTFSGRLDVGGLVPAHLAATSDVRTGVTAVVLNIAPSGMASGSNLILAGVSSGMNHLTVHQIPA